MDLGLAGKTFIVTGASSGLGRASAEALLAEGAAVVAVARRADVLEQWRTTAGERLAVVTGDIADTASVEAAAQAAITQFGGLDGALVSVGGPPRGGVVDNTDDEWRAAFESVFLGALRVARTVTDRATSGPVIGFVLSTSVKAPLPSMAISNGLRPGLAMLIKQLGDELGPVGGRSFGLLPGQIDTDRLQWLHSQSGDFAATRAASEATIPMRRVGVPDEFGKVAAFLLSPAASYITGCMIPVDGGATRAL